MSQVTLEGITCAYREVVAVRDVNLLVREGEFLSLLGPSGCGKTTTLRLVAGFLRPTAGRVLFDNEDVSTRPANKREIGMVFQDYALFPHMTVADNIGFGLRERRVADSAIRRRVDELLNLVRLPNIHDRFPSEISGGQRQRVALARAVASPPRVLLMDEPLGALDLKLREAMQIEIKAFQKQLRVTTIYVTHDQSEAMSMSDRIAVMDQGRIRQVDTPEVIYKKPRSKFVADFVGRINCIPVNVECVSGRMAVASYGTTPIQVEGTDYDGAGAASLLIRPENITLSAPKDERLSPAANALTGTIETTRFQGNRLYCDVRVGADLMLSVETAPDDALAVAGATVTAGWAPSLAALLGNDD